MNQLQKATKWKVHIYSYGWFYSSRNFPGLDYIPVMKNQTVTVFIGMYYISFRINHNFYLLDLNKKSDLPVTDIYAMLGKERYTDCNISEEFSLDQMIAGTFHENFFKNYSCVLPFWYGNHLAKTRGWNICKGRQSYLYNDVEANRAISKVIDSMPILPCDWTKVSFGPVHAEGKN